MSDVSELAQRLRYLGNRNTGTFIGDMFDEAATALLSLSAKVAEQAEEIDRLTERVDDLTWSYNHEVKLREDAEATTRLFSRLLTETAVPALEDVAKWVGGMCSCRADDDYHDGLLKALSAIRAQMEGGNG